ncbi:MAG: hypothetical protein H7331_07925, partial [Bacteroidia bacterium]|nr:hypothetical protein [Bacteroidia bacterium]
MKKIIFLLAMCFTLSAISQTSITGSGTKLPSQTGNAGKYLKTNGSQLSWATVTAGLSASLTTGYVPYAVSSTSLANSAIYQANNGYIGINTTSPITSSYAGFSYKASSTAGAGYLWAEFADVNPLVGLTIKKDGDITTGIDLCSGNFGAGYGSTIFMDGTNRMVSFLGYPYCYSAVNIMLNSQNLTNNEKFSIGSGEHGINTGGNIWFYGANSSNSNQQSAYASVRGLKENATDGDTKSFLSFSTNDGASVTEKMNISSNGN